jgi:hypothetical protein
VPADGSVTGVAGVAGVDGVDGVAGETVIGDLFATETVGVSGSFVVDDFEVPFRLRLVR